jgi:hypothetical protein
MWKKQMDHMIQVVLFGAMVCTIASTALALAPAFRPDRKGFGNRFRFFLWRFSLPAWGGLELLVVILTGRPYP